MKLDGRTAIVTGAATGLGLAFAKRLAADGANVVLADIKGAEEAAAGITREGGSAIGVYADVTSETDVAAMVEHTVNRFGGVDILVNNAAISSTLKLAPFEDLTVPQWQHMLNVNTISVFICCRAVAPHMRAKRYGRIINLTSGTAFKGAPMMLHYVASKGAIISMTRSLSREFGGDNITVNAISPGYTLSEGMFDNPEFLNAARGAAVTGRALPREAYPVDIVGALSFLASEDAAFITGQILAVDGGSVNH